MSVFHYVADQLKDVDLFDSKPSEAIKDGSIYNDFDGCPLDLLDDDSVDLFCFSQTSNTQTNDSNVDTCITEAVDNAIMEEDAAVGVLSEHLQWETPLFDSTSDLDCGEYMNKVFILATDSERGLDELTITKEAVSMFERRLRTNWEGSDSVYDAWLLKKGFQRACFDYHKFHVCFPDCSEILDKRTVNENDSEDIEERQSEHAIDDSDFEIEKNAKRRKTNVECKSVIKSVNTPKNTSEEERDDKTAIKFNVCKIIPDIIVISSSEED